MSIQFNVYPVAELVAYVVEGALTDAEAGAFLESVFTHPQFRRGFDFVGVCRGADTPYPPPLARALSARAARVGPCRWAVVAGAYGVEAVGRWRRLVPVEGVVVAAFEAQEQAIDWLAGAQEWRPLDN